MEIEAASELLELEPLRSALVSLVVDGDEMAVAGGGGAARGGRVAQAEVLLEALVEAGVHSVEQLRKRLLVCGGGGGELGSGGELGGDFSAVMALLGAELGMVPAADPTQPTSSLRAARLARRLLARLDGLGFALATLLPARRSAERVVVRSVRRPEMNVTADGETRQVWLGATSRGLVGSLSLGRPLVGAAMRVFHAYATASALLDRAGLGALARDLLALRRGERDDVATGGRDQFAKADVAGDLPSHAPQSPTRATAAALLTRDGFEARMRSIFAEEVARGAPPNLAAARALQRAAAEQQAAAAPSTPRRRTAAADVLLNLLETQLLLRSSSSCDHVIDKELTLSLAGFLSAVLRGALRDAQLVAAAGCSGSSSRALEEFLTRRASDLVRRRVMEVRVQRRASRDDTSSGSAPWSVSYQASQSHSHSRGSRYSGVNVAAAGTYAWQVDISEQFEVRGSLVWLLHLHHFNVRRESSRILVAGAAHF